MNFSALVNTKTLIYGAGLVGTSAAGTAGWQAIDGAVGGQRRYSFVSNPLGGFENGINTSTINAGNENNVLGLKRGKCFSKFFPGLSGSNPPVYAKDTKITPTLPDMDLSDNPVGCATVKFSKLKNKNSFIYKSEFTIKTVSDGLAFYMGVTNLKETEKLYYEFGITFLKRGHWNGYETGHESGSIEAKDSGLSSKVFINTDTFVHLTAGARQANEGTDLTNASEREDKTFSGFWTTPAEGQKVAFIEEGSAEKGGLKNRYKVEDPVTKKINNTASALLNKIKLTQKGKWTTPKEYCAKVQTDSNKFPLSAPKRDRDICYVSK